MDPIAIIGYSLKLPGDADTPAGFWKLLIEGRNVCSLPPTHRYNPDGFYHPDPARLDSMRVRHGHFCKEDPAYFDAPFFNMSPSEAMDMDPQQRNLLEGAYHAFENAGLKIEKLSGTDTSVYAACFCQDYQLLSSRDGEVFNVYQATGHGASMLSNRISHFYDLRGASVTLDTACSSGLAAFHLACQSIRSGESTMSVVSGANCILTPQGMALPLSNANFLSPDGRSYSFQERGNGYGRGEGFATVVLKRMSEAIKDGDTIRAIVRGTLINQDGRTPSITQPSGSAQVDMIRATYEAAGLSLDQTAYVEAHGTGTFVGDPIEANAIGAVFDRAKNPDRPLYLGSVKSNIGHTEGTSGLAGLLKAVMALENGTIPPIADLKEPNPSIKLKDYNLRLPAKAVPWPNYDVKRVSISSFGYGGTNAHAILDDVPSFFRSFQSKAMSAVTDGISSNGFSTKINGTHVNGHSNSRSNYSTDPSHDNPKLEANGTTERNPDEIVSRLLVLSAGDGQGLERQAELLQQHISTLPDHMQTDKYFQDLLHTLGTKRSKLPWKSYASVRSIEDIQDLAKVIAKPVRSPRAALLSFVFTGQGAQWPQMGLDLIVYETFKRSLQSSQSLLSSLACSWNLFEELARAAKTSHVSKPALAQPLTTCVQIALVDLLQSWDIIPESVCGHSSGEIAAAYCIGALDHLSAIKVAYYRGKISTGLIESAKEATSMMAVGLSAEKVQPYLQELQSVGDLSIGCINSPTNVTLTGSRKAIEILEKRLGDEGHFARNISVLIGYHSKEMSQGASAYKALINGLRSREVIGLRPTMFSSVEARWVEEQRLTEPSYWVANLVSQVRFSEALSGLAIASFDSNNDQRQAVNQPLRLFMEIGPNAALKRPINETMGDVLGSGKFQYISTIKPKFSGPTLVTDAVGMLVVHGLEPDLDSINRISTQTPAMLTDLPAYPFSRSQKYWRESRISKNYRFRQAPRHPLLGVRATDWNPTEASWRHFIRSAEAPWILDHALNASPLYPGAGMIAMALEAARELSTEPEKISGYRVKNIRFLKALTVDNTVEGVEAQIHVRPSKGSKSGRGWLDWRVFGVFVDEISEVAHGSVRVEYLDEDANNGSESRREKFNLSTLQKYRAIDARCNFHVHQTHLYENMAEQGYNYGPSFQLLHTLKYDKQGSCSAKLNLRDYASRYDFADVDPCIIHPSTLDCIIQSGMAAGANGGWKKIPTMMFTHINEMWLSNDLLTLPGNPKLQVATYQTFQGFREMEHSCVVLFEDSQTPAIISRGQRGMAITNIGSDDTDATDMTSQLCYHLQARPDLSLMTKSESQTYFDKLFDSRDKPSQTKIDRADALCLHFIEQALSCDWNKPTGHLAKFVKLMKDTQFARSKYSLVGRGYAAGEETEFLQSYKSIDEPSLNLIANIGPNLPAILNGDIDPLQFIFENDLVEHFYHSDLISMSTSKIGKIMDLLAHENPRMKILEIGAGTAAASSQVLPHLLLETIEGQFTARYDEYMYTDISPHFFEHAKERFPHHTSGMKFAKLDISEDPSEQGFDSEYYDVIIACNVLHATKDLRRTLHNTKSLLRPGGKLIMTESTNPDSLRDNFIFGLLPGWWLSTEPERAHGPTFTDKQWNDILLECGFSGLDLCFKDFDDEPYHRISTHVSSKLSNSEASSQPDIILLIDKQSKQQKSLASDIERLLQDAAISTSTSDLLSLTPAQLQEAFVLSLLELEESYFPDASAQFYDKFKEVALKAKKVFWVVGGGIMSKEDPRFSCVTGLARTINNELNESRFSTIQFSAKESIARVVDAVARILLKVLQNADDLHETEFAVENGVPQITRLMPSSDTNTGIQNRMITSGNRSYTIGDSPKPHASLTIGSAGLLDTLYFREMVDTPLAADEVEIEICTSSINFKDVMIALGQIPGAGFGFDGAGYVTQSSSPEFQKGDPVIFITTNGAFATFTRCPAYGVQKVPKNLLLSTMGSLPVVWTTAIYAIDDVARLQEGESVLIHGGAGGFGQAAIQLAQHRGAKVYTTVGSEDKRKLLINSLGVSSDCIFQSRDATFADDILHATAGRGVDVVLNSLSGELLHRSWECVTYFGRFVEIGKRDIIDNNVLSLAQFDKNVTFSAVDLTLVASKAPKVMKSLLRRLVDFFADANSGFRAHEPIQVFKASEIELAFRLMQSGKNVGKATIDFSNGDTIQYKPTVLAPRQMRGDATYVVSGGFGGLGKAITRWMVELGARNIILLSRSGRDKDGSSRSFVAELQKAGVKVWAEPCDVTDAAVLKEAIEQCKGDMPPIKGCVIGTMVLHDAPFENMDSNMLHTALQPKVRGSLNLHNLLPSDMDFFVMLSSKTGIIGNRGQANYCAGNCFQNALNDHRLSIGRQSAVINLSMVLEVGWVAQSFPTLQALRRAGFGGVGQNQLLAMMDILCTPTTDLPKFDTSRHSVSTFVNIVNSIDKATSVDWIYKPMFRQLYQIRASKSRGTTSASAEGSIDYLAETLAAADLNGATDVVLHGLSGKLARSLSRSVEEMDSSQPAFMLGVDSLIAVELRQWILKELKVEVAVFNILKEQSLLDLCLYIAKIVVKFHK